MMFYEKYLKKKAVPNFLVYKNTTKHGSFTQNNGN